MEDPAAHAGTRFAIEPAEDAMSVYLTLEPSPDAESLVPGILQAASDLKLAVPVNSKVVEAACRAAAEGKRARAVLARGTPAEDGRDASFMWSKKIRGGDNGEHGGRRSHYLGPIARRVVKAGDPVAKVTPETRGTEGRDIYGKAVKATNGKPMRVQAGANIREDDNIFFAVRDGIVRLEKSRLMLDEMFVVEGALTFDTGNIDFPGFVIIRGGILDLFEIRAGGAINVEGLVEAATLIAKGDIEINGGIAGKKKGEVRAGGSVHAKFLVNADVCAGRDVTVETQLINSKVLSKGTVRVPRGALAGGEVTALGGVEAETVGSESAVTTAITAGVNYELEAVMKAVEAEMKEAQKRLPAIERDLKSLAARTPSDDVTARMKKLAVEKLGIEKRLKAAEARRNSTLAFTRKAAAPHVIVSKAIYPGVVVRVGDCKTTVNEMLAGPLRLVGDRKTGGVRFVRVTQ